MLYIKKRLTCNGVHTYKNRLNRRGILEVRYLYENNLSPQAKE